MYREFDRISERGGVLGAMETMYQRSKIQEESLYYETLKHDGTLPIVGVNTFLGARRRAVEMLNAQLIRSTEEEKQDAGERRCAHSRRAMPSAGRPRSSSCSRTAASGGNVFAQLMETVKVASLGSLSHALYEVGGQYRRSM